eukprot:gb/GECG01014317.1/.p1 GENE.gb/GECG01014317.1/~~gb/GECG01014317.1/.p1  ORF type:complete len:655 (+),score=74.53 gb/GECG01014317.1/:1-1965(+)
MQLQRSTHTKSLLQKKYPKNPELKKLSDSDWFMQIGNRIRNLVSQRCMRDGIPFAEKAPPMLRCDLIEFARRFLAENNPEAMMRRAAIVINWLAVGRAGEVALMTWNCLSLPITGEYLTADWAQKKTSTFQPMSFFPDRSNYEIDCLHCFGTYLITSRGNYGEQNFIFPQLQRIKAPATKLTTWLKEKDEDQVNYVGTSLRIGASNQMANTRDVELHHIIARGGWECQGINNVFHYLLQLFESINVGGRALAGWTDCKTGAYLPRLVFMTEDNRKDIETFLTHLFGQNTAIFRDISSGCTPITGLLHAMLASLLMYFDDVLTDWGSKSHIIQQITDAASESGIQYFTLLMWGRLVKTDFNERNLDSISSSDILDQAGKLRSEIHELRSTVVNSLQGLTEEIKVLKDLQRKEEIDRVPVSPSGTPLTSSAQRKRSRSPSETGVNEESSQDRAKVTSSKKSLNDVLQKKPTILKEFCIEKLKGYRLSTFLGDYVRHGLAKPGMLSAACKNKQDRKYLSKVINFAKKDPASQKLFECSKLDVSKREVKDQINLLAAETQERVMARLADLEKEIPTNEKSEDVHRKKREKTGLVSAVAKRIPSDDKVVPRRQANSFFNLGSSQSASDPELCINIDVDQGKHTKHPNPYSLISVCLTIT